MKILIENLQDKVEVQDALKENIEKVVLLSLDKENVKIDSQVSIYFVDNEKIQEINKKTRDVDKITDVLTFPIAEFDKGRLSLLSGDIDMDNGLLILGDIVISLEKAVFQAKEYGHSVEREILFLITHGMYHILGYDHMTPADEKEMMNRQEEVLSELNINRN
ncbi:MAG: rRNA maturation RNase YbeY [Clostridiales bacterium]|nr:rRNA maturation RNase YbeY [Clostridiales bacterium]